MQSKLLAVALALFLAIFLGYRLFRTASPSTLSTTATLQGDPNHPGATAHWVDTRLYFGLGPVDAKSAVPADTAWQDFLDHEVTPRFPAGLSVIDVAGQWQGKDQPAPKHIRTKLLIIDYPATADNDAQIEAIRAAWKKRTGDQSVLKVTQPADVSF
jgi:hypothetical protein